MNELYAYLESLENRIQKLEGENQALSGPKESMAQYIQELGGDAQKFLPRTRLVSPNFIQRAFAVWGHYFIAQLIISIPLTCISLIVIYWLMQQGISILPLLPTP